MREAHKDLEWFGPPERNTLRPLCDVLPGLVCKLGGVAMPVSACVKTCGTSCLCLCELVILPCVLSLLYDQGEHVH